MDPKQLTQMLGSPLRLKLVSELFSATEPLNLLELVYRSGRNVQDVLACLQPLVRTNIIEEDKETANYRLSDSLSEPHRQAISDTLIRWAERLKVERHVREQVLGGMIGLDPKMQFVFEIIQQVARVDVPVLISGEIGTGKSLVARAIHDTGGRRNAPFTVLDCATISEALFESELFGHQEGAFTGAVRTRIGLLEACGEGTLFLDQIGNLGLSNQAKLLRVLQDRTFRKVGGDGVQTFGGRLIATTHEDLASAVESGLFREDLWYRINVFPIRVPSLRERLSDMPYLVAGILSANRHNFPTGEQPAVQAETMDQLKEYSWPGNVRELENVLLHAAIGAAGREIKPEDLPPLQMSKRRTRSVTPVSLMTLKEAERAHVRRVLRECKQNIKAAAQVLAISRTTLYKKIADYGLEIEWD